MPNTSRSRENLAQDDINIFFSKIEAEIFRCQNAKHLPSNSCDVGIIDWITEIARLTINTEGYATGGKKDFQQRMLKIAATATAAYQWANTSKYIKKANSRKYELRFIGLKSHYAFNGGAASMSGKYSIDTLKAILNMK